MRYLNLVFTVFASAGLLLVFWRKNEHFPVAMVQLMLAFMIAREVTQTIKYFKEEKKGFFVASILAVIFGAFCLILSLVKI